MDEAPKTEEFIVGDSFARILTETTQSLVCVYDRDGRILLFNEACERATGFTRDDVLGATHGTSSSRPRSARRSASSSPTSGRRRPPARRSATG